MILKKLSILFVFLFLPFMVFADGEKVGQVFRGEVVGIVSEEEELDFIKEIPIRVQNLEVRDRKTGEILEVYNDYRPVWVGQKVFYSVNDFGGDNYQNFLVGISRITQIVLLGILFVIIVVIFSGAKGVRSLISLALSFLAIIFILLPLILKGVNPLIVGPFLAFLILFFAIFFSYGFNKVSKIAFMGTVISVVITSLLAFLSIK
jgi:uncharacterized membrane protein